MGPLALALLAAACVLLVHAFNVRRSFYRHKANVIRSGFPHVYAPLVSSSIPGYLGGILLSSLAQKLPKRLAPWEWVTFSATDDSWKSLRSTYDKFGDTVWLLGLNGPMLRTTSAELINQITTRKTDFPKPISMYKILETFGPAILSTEGEDWKRHKKIVASSFSEKSNRLAFEESLRQVDGMVQTWKEKGGCSENDIRVDDTKVDTAVFSLHVICAAGFGVPQAWRDCDVEKGAWGYVDGESSHQLKFKDSMPALLQSLHWFELLPTWLVEMLPLAGAKKATLSKTELTSYFNDLLELKKKEMTEDGIDKGTMDLMGTMIRASESAPEDLKTSLNETLTRQEIISNSFIFFLAGHETSANLIHFSFLELAMSLPAQRRMQADIDAVVGTRPSAQWSYLEDMPRLYNSYLGAVMNEVLRLEPSTINIPKTTAGDQRVVVDGVEHIIPDGTYISINVPGTQRNKRYYPHAESKVEGKDSDIDDFVPERWLLSKNELSARKPAKEEVTDGLDNVSFETSNSLLFKPPKGAFMVFSDGARGCPGKRFAQVEAVAALAKVFAEYTVELDVSAWASDEQVARMSGDEKREVYEKAKARTAALIRRSEEGITLRMRAEDEVPLRFVKRGEGRFVGVY